MNVIIYDVEIHRAIPKGDGSKTPGIEYCAGWNDHANMGISTIGVYGYAEDRYRVFCDDNKGWFADLLNRAPLLVGFNNIAFDNQVIRQTDGWGEPQDDDCYDILREIWIAAGLGVDFNHKTHGGYGLDAMCEKNFGTKKTGNGALAPIAWQQGEVGQVIDYCLNDIRLTKQLFDAAYERRLLLSPKGGTFDLRIPGVPS